MRAGAITEMPDGYEVSESVNGVVSVCRKQPGIPSVPDEDVELVRSAVGRAPRLEHHQVQRLRNAIVVFEPERRAFEDDALERDLGVRIPPSYIAARIKKGRFAPVMKFERAGEQYHVLRMTYRGSGGWSHPLESGELRSLVRKFVGSIGTDRFFELL